MEFYDELCKLDEEMRSLRERIEGRRRELARLEVGEYTFQGSDGAPMTLAQLFGEKNDLLVVHNMGKSCSYCSLWADVLNGMMDQIEERTAFALVSPDDVDTQRRLAADRDWKFSMVSSRGSTFTHDMGYEDGDGNPMPGVSSFHRAPSGVTRISSAPFGEDDEFCAVWRLFDLLQDGANGWAPK